MSMCSCMSPQEERVIGKQKVDRKGRERVYNILERIQFSIPACEGVSLDPEVMERLKALVPQN